jgi:hypothetical protein
MLQSFLQIFYKNKSTFVGTKLINNTLKFLGCVTKNSTVMKELAPHVEIILYEHIIPVLYLSERDVQLWTDDPQEYIRKLYDFSESYYTPKNSGLDLLIYLCTMRTNKKDKEPTYLKGFLQFCLGNLVEYQN